MKDKVLPSSILWVLTAGGQALAVWICCDPGASSARINAGWLIIFISGIFGWLPIFTFRSRGEVRGPSYVHTTALVDSGLYSTARHPQYMAGALIALALPLITWHWLVVLRGAASGDVLVERRGGGTGEPGRIRGRQPGISAAGPPLQFPAGIDPQDQGPRMTSPGKEP